MFRTGSSLTVMVLFVSLASAQTEAIQKEVEERLKSLRADDTELKRILANHPEIRIAEAKIQLAKEQLLQVESDLTKRYMDLKSNLKVQKLKMEFLQTQVARYQKQKKEGVISDSVVAAEELKLVELKAELDRLEMDLQTFLSVNPRDDANVESKKWKLRSQYFETLKEFSSLESNTTLDKLKSVIDQQITFNCTGKKASQAVKDLNEKLGAEIIVRMNDTLTDATVTVNGKLPFTTWIEMILDDCNSQSTQLNTGPDWQKYLLEAYVRDYGILITYRSKCPQDAMTLREFTAKVRAEKTARTAPKK